MTRGKWGLAGAAVLTMAGFWLPLDSAEPFIWIAPLLPFPLFLVGLLRPLPLPAARFAAILAGVTGGVMVLGGLIFNGAGALLSFGHVLGLTIAVVGWFRWTGGSLGRFGATPIAVGAVMGALSLLQAPWVLWSAARLADGAPFCLAHHGTEPEPVHSWTELRAVSFYTVRSGYRQGDSWYFHGLLLTGDQVYNWSPRRQRFDLLAHPERQFVDPRRACSP